MNRSSISLIREKLPYGCGVSVVGMTPSQIDDMMEWCESEFGESLVDGLEEQGVWDRWYSIGVLTFYFKHEADAIMFKLKFGGQW